MHKKRKERYHIRVIETEPNRLINYLLNEIDNLDKLI